MLKVGDKVPQVQVMQATAEGPKPLDTAAFFAGKRVALFAVPGAFTPTCSAKHVPNFLEHAGALHAAGVDAIACISVNDAFVMGAWGKDQGVGERITMLADGNGAFTKAAGLELDGAQFGMGLRSQRYALLAKDGVVEALHVEQGGGFEASKAEHLLAALGK